MRTFGTVVTTRRIGGFALSLMWYAPDAVLPWHEHAEPYVTFVIDGAYRELLRSVARECVARSIVFHPAGEKHADSFGPAETTCLDIRVDSADCEIEHAATIAPQLIREFVEGDPDSALVIEELLLELLRHRRPHSSTTRGVPRWLEDVRGVVEAGRPVPLARLAEIAGVHPTHLVRSFRSHYGCTIGEMVRARRIERAKLLLRRGRPIVEVSADLDFSDQSHFTRTFRRLTGQTPAAYRRERC